MFPFQSEGDISEIRFFIPKHAREAASGKFFVSLCV